MCPLGSSGFRDDIFGTGDLKLLSKSSVRWEHFNGGRLVQFAHSLIISTPRNHPFAASVLSLPLAEVTLSRCSLCTEVQQPLLGQKPLPWQRWKQSPCFRLRETSQSTTMRKWHASSKMLSPTSPRHCRRCAPPFRNRASADCFHLCCAFPEDLSL